MAASPAEPGGLLIGSSSLNFPTSSGAFQPAAGGGGFDVFVTKLNPSGTALDYSTYIGGSASDGGTSILVDGTGSAYVTGFTFSANFPTAGGPFQANKSAERDAFLLKLDSNGNLVQSGFFGGAGADEAWDTAMDASGNVYIAGRTTSTDLPTTSGAFQPMNRSGSGGITNFFIEGFVACFDSSGQLQAGTYVGGNGQDEMFGVEVDSNNQIAVAGFSSSTDLITTSFQSSNQGGFDALFYLLDQQLGLVYGTYLGGEDNDWAYDVATDFFGNAFIFGETRSLNFPTTPNAYQAYNAGMMDVFVAQFGTDPRSGGSPAQNGDIVFRYGTLVGSPPDDFSNNITARSFGFGPAPGGPTLITFAGQTDHVGSFPTRSAGAGLRSSGSGWFFAINNEDHFTINVIDSPPGTVPGDFTVNPDKNTIHFVDGQGSQVVQLEYAISGDSVEVDVTASNNIFLAEPRHIDRLSMDGLLIADGSQGEWVRMSDSDANDRWVYPGPVKPIGIRTSGTNIGVVATKNFSFWDAGPARETPIRLNVGQEAESNTFFRNAIAYDATNLYVELQERDGSWAIDRYTLMNDGSGSFIESDRVLETGEPIDNSTFGIAGFGHRVAAAFSNHVQFAEVFSNGTAFVDTPGGPVQLCGMLGDQAIMTWDRDMSGTFDIVLVDPLFPDDFIPAGEFPPGVVPICSDLVDLDLDGDLDLVGEVQGPPGSFIATMNFPGEGDPELKTSIPITGDGRGAFPSIYVDTTQGPDTNDLGFGVAYSNEVAAVWTEATDMFTSPSTFQTGLVGVSDAHITLFSRDLTEFGTVFNFSYEHLDPGLSEESRPEDGVAQGTDQFTGYAVANLGTTTGPAVFTAMDTAGTLITGPNITNPAKRTSNPGEQLPIVDTQLFGSGFTDSSRVAWVEVKSTLAKLTGFFLTFNSNLTFLDGADASIAKLTAFVFPEIEDEGFNDLRVANPCPLPTDLAFQLLQSDGKLRTTPVTRRINARGVLAGSFTDLFPGVSPVGSDYLLVAATRGVVPFQLLGKSEAFVHALNGQDYTGGSTTLYCPQYVIGGADWRTTLSVVNLDSKAGSITFRFFSDAGVQQGATKMMAVSPRGKLFVTDQTFFLDAGDTLTQGYLVITADVRMSGSVIFGDPARSRFSAALPLVSNLLTDIVYGQLASNDTYFMGVAVLNPGGTALTATIEVYDASGTLQFTVDVAVPAGERRSQLLTQYIPAMVGQDFSSGYVRVRLNRVGASFSLYGTNVLDVLAAVTAQAAP